MAKNKFDTNQLDPEFPEKVRQAETNALPKDRYGTAEMPPPSVTEEQTRRFGGPDFDEFRSTYDGQNLPADYRTTNLAGMNRTSKRNVSKIGLPENILTALPYIPWYIGLIAGLIILFVVPKSETKVRFHAAQGVAAHLAILIVSAILGILGNIPGLHMVDVGNGIFNVVTMVMLIIFAIKAWQGKPVHIELIEDLTVWLEDKIKQRD